MLQLIEIPTALVAGELEHTIDKGALFPTEFANVGD
jgi:hypothetical protein